MEEKKKIKLVTVKIIEGKLYDEREKSIIFRVGAGRAPLILPKSQMYNFEKVVTWFPTPGGGRVSRRAFMFKIPLWLYEKNQIHFDRMHNNCVIENTHLDYNRI